MEQDLQQLHEIELEILLEFRRICEKHNLTYYLVAGTLLGAVRHKGFIPWDDDVDVAMPRKDFEYFCSICDSELQSNYFLQTKKTDKAYFLEFAKIRKNGTHVFEPRLEHLNIHKGIYIDIFAIDKCPSNQFLARLCFRLQYLLNTSIETQSGMETGYSGDNWFYKMVFLLFSKVKLPILYKTQRLLIACMNQFSGNEYCCTLSGRHGYPNERYKTVWLQKGKMLSFEKYTFSVPENWDNVLRNMYGDYWRMPEDKETHFSYFEV